MDASTLDKRVAILRASVTPDAYGGDVQTWATLATRWARKIDVNDSEAIEAGGVLANVTSRFLLRWDSVTETITPEDQLEFGGRRYEIRGVKDAQGREGIGRREAIEITTVARADLG
ncbi:MAG: phage head closure protein [Hyphomonadaceae bacterium]|nr:phage head closure protein [Hyphomonadaceae bacterium]